ncbi:hypothetical protein [Maridesulfovibrio sp.]|uniref:hypothetical protein n=1 Tax=Maridesulfovibrio sp. TaxID=2795000 RepID=UPI0039EFCBB5
MRAIRGKGLLITFTNAKARVIRTCGDLGVLEQADKLNFGPGANWAEECVGTNAIGTALKQAAPCRFSGRAFLPESPQLELYRRPYH